jgi:hypothetical protein
MAQGKKMGVRERLAKARECKAERSKLFKELCQHIREGFSLDAWGWMRPELVEEWLKCYSQEFVAEELQRAVSDAKQMWEGIGKHQAQGLCHGNAQSWKFNMTNRYKWIDKVNIDADIKGSVAVEVISYASQKPSQHSESVVNT